MYDLFFLLIIIIHFLPYDLQLGTALHYQRHHQAKV